MYGIDAESISDTYPIQWVSTGLPAVLIPLKDIETLAKVKVNKDAFKQYIYHHPENNCNHLFFVDRKDNTFAARCLMEDFVEDPATGSDNGNLAGYPLEHNYFNSNDISYMVIQGEDMCRKSVLQIHASKHDEDWYIAVGGQCHIVASGDWAV